MKLVKKNDSKGTKEVEFEPDISVRGQRVLSDLLLSSGVSSNTQKLPFVSLKTKYPKMNVE